MVQGVLIVSWVFGTGLPGRIGAIVLGAGRGGGRRRRRHARPQRARLARRGARTVGRRRCSRHQLLRAGRRVRVVESLSNIALLLVAIVALSSLLELRHQVDGPALATAVLLCATAALVAGHLIDWVWSPLRFDPAVSRGLPAVVGVGDRRRGRRRGPAAATRSSSPASGPLLLGGALALVTAMFAVGAAFIAHDPTGAGPAGVGPGAAPVVRRPLFAFALMSPLAYLLCLALRG